MLFVGGAECGRGALLLQTRLPEVLGDSKSINVEERKVSDGKALALEAEREEGASHWVRRRQML